MCGIFGYVGEPADLGQSLTTALKTLEYRGYDSWGIAIGLGDHIGVEKQVGRINGSVPTFPYSRIGFGHTRWATHGGVTTANAHPHLDCSGRIAVIHNGIIENFQLLRAELTSRGHDFNSDTDSEVVAHLIEEELDRGHDLTDALAGAFARLHGLNAVIAMDVMSNEMVAAKNVSPLIAGIGPTGVTIASDALALQPHADRVHYLEDDQLVNLSNDGISLLERTSRGSLPPRYTALEQSTRDAGLGHYPHFMAKEIAEQPEVLERLNEHCLPSIVELAAAIKASTSTVLTGCGTAGYAALTGSYLLGRIASRFVPTVVGSEFKYHRHLISSGGLVIALSQSGETADLIEAMHLAKQHDARLAALVNVERSTLDRMVDLRVPLRAGPEQCVLATKSYLAKVAALLITSHALAGDPECGANLVQQAADAIRALMSDGLAGQVREIAALIADQANLFVVGRGLAYPTALEAALKIKEVSYIHAEAFAGGELKHGVIALVESGTPCLVFAPNDETRADIVSGAAELKSRGGFIIGIGPAADAVFDVHIAVPDVGDAAPLVNAVPAQLLGYSLALLRGNDPDRPRNLAKSVTVK